MADNWAWPRRLDPTTRDASPGGVVPLGTMRDGIVGAIDDHGTVQLVGRTWSFEWWVGAEDRWHRSGSEVAVRQERLGAGPVVETSLRVPGGDVVARAAAVEAGGSMVAVEVENRSAVPVALALVVRPFALDGPGRIERVDVDGPGVVVDGVPAFVLDRVPGAVVFGGAGDDLGDRLEGAGGPAATRLRHQCDDAMATVAIVVPLAHTAVTRLALGTADARVLARVPPVDHVAEGWSAHLGGAELDLPDEAGSPQLDLASVVLSARDLAASGFGDRGHGLDHEVRVLEALVRSGHPVAADEVDRWLAANGVPAGHCGAAAMVVARAALDAEPGWFDDYLGWAADSIGRGVGRNDPDAQRAAAALGVLLQRADQPEAAREVAAGWQPAPVVPDLDPVGVVDPAAAATRLLRRIQGAAVDRPDGVDVLARAPSSWWGRPIDVRHLGTAHGEVSFAVRWHGARPALLWEREPWPGTGSWTIRCPGLDPTWSATADRGEALLAEPTRSVD